jgi:hypothetical protein
VDWFVRVSKDQFASLCSGGKIISAHRIYGPKVILLPSGDYIKVFNPKSGLTKRKFFPKYKTFVKNTEQLRAYGIPSVTVNQVYFLEEYSSYAVSYTPLSGMDVRSLAEKNPKQTVDDLIPFLVELHEKGIYFRGIHLGNVLKLDNGQYGLIDVADLYFKRGPLSILLRVRNLAHMLKNRDDQGFFAQYGVERLLERYAKTARLFDIRKLWFDLWIRLYLRS